MPIVYAYLIRDVPWKEGVSCTNCGNYELKQHTKYCPNCNTSCRLEKTYRHPLIYKTFINCERHDWY